MELGAPGAGVISAYPGGLFAAGWGTSFAAPLVSGSVALIQALHSDPDKWAAQRKVHALKQGSVRLPDLNNELGSGRLDVAATVVAAE